MKKVLYCLYDGDTCLGVGSAEYLADTFGLKPGTIKFLACECSRKKKLKKTAVKIVVEE